MIIQAEPVSKRRRQHAGASGRSNQSEVFEGYIYNFGKCPLVDHKVDFEIFHRRIQEFFDGWRESMNLIDEENVPLTQTGENTHQIAGSLQRRSGTRKNLGLHFIGNNMG